MFTKSNLVYGSVFLFLLAGALYMSPWLGPNTYTRSFMLYARPFICLIGFFAGAGFGVASFFHPDDEGGIFSKLVALTGIALNALALIKIIPFISRS
jgi:hypothetical protein